MRLEEAPKADILKWRPGDPFTRKVRVTMRRDARTFDAIVDLTAGKVLSHRQLPGVQPSIMQHEFDRARALTKASPRWQAAMRRRNLTDFSKIGCTPLPPGRFPDSPTQQRRILMVICYDNTRAISRYTGQPIEGVVALVDIDGERVVNVIDRDVVVPPAQSVERAAGKPPQYRAPLKPVLNLSPEGRNFQIERGWLIRWQGWSFQLRIERQIGPVISLVKLRQNGIDRLMAYQLSLSEMFVPYMDTDPTWSFRTFMDAGEYGIGYLASSLAAGKDCPLQSAFITVGIPGDRGTLFAVKRAVCVFERATGDPLWRHRDPATKRIASRPDIELVVRMITTVGNYDYALDWVFRLDGSIKARVGALGYLAVKTVTDVKPESPVLGGETSYGTLVAPGVLGVYHDHQFSFRLDLDVDGQANSLVREEIVPKRLPETAQRRSIWTLRSTTIAREGPVREGKRPTMWRVINPNRVTSRGYYPGIQILPGQQAPSVLSPDDPAQGRAAFSAEKMWVSRYKPDERRAAGDFANQSEPGQGLPEFVGDGESVENKDLVIWYSAGFHHVTRTEDWPIMPGMWLEFTLRPFNMLDKNPAADLAPDFQQRQ